MAIFLDLARVGVQSEFSKVNKAKQMILNSDDARVYGEESQWISISVKQDTSRVLLENALICHWLKTYQILHVGIMNAKYPYEVVRTDQSGTYMMVILEGHGEVLFDGGWQVVRAGEACLLPPYMYNAFRCLEGVPWKFVWVRYGESKGVQPIAGTNTPVKGKLNGLPLESAVRGLWHEINTKNDEELALKWAELIHRNVLHFARPADLDDRLWKVWKKAEEQLARRWTLTELASIGNMSEEHLRRLCLKQFGRSPKQHLIYLRMIKAREMLITSDAKVSVIANAVGYDSGFTFSNTFKKWAGIRPSELRA